MPPHEFPDHEKLQSKKIKSYPLSPKSLKEIEDPLRSQMAR
jgi:hypothetical protein